MGGDLIDVIESDGNLLVYIADVSGHGLAAGQLMGMLKTAGGAQFFVGIFQDLGHLPSQTGRPFAEAYAALQQEGSNLIDQHWSAGPPGGRALDAELAGRADPLS
jgi:hypothetical protein